MFSILLSGVLHIESQRTHIYVKSGVYVSTYSESNVPHISLVFLRDVSNTVIQNFRKSSDSSSHILSLSVQCNQICDVSVFHMFNNFRGSVCHVEEKIWIDNNTI